MVITARRTMLFSVSITLTLTGISIFSSNGGISFSSAMARRSVLAFFKYSTVMPVGIQRWVVGMVTSVAVPAASSAILQMAMACTVPMWLRTARRFLICSSL